MYLKKLNLFGFKSFPEKTSLKFNSGITAVVGPNGCGKSNVFDAIKWALGEQKPKSLRGAKMEDIIFSGTENHPALSYAEVSLTFSNEDKYLPINYNEVLISRRLYRSGDSQYFVNKSPVRLKDIQNLFMGTGIGESTYSFVEQGKIEALLSYKPEDKRLIFDEASGIVKYKERKKETLRRLAEADENIVRLDDILAEVRRQINYLERQAVKAENYKKAKKDLIEVEKGIAAQKSQELDVKISNSNSGLGELEKEEGDILGQLSFLGQGLDKATKEQDGSRTELDRLNTLIISAQAQIKTYQNNIDFSRQRIKELEERSKQLISSQRNLEEKLSLQIKRSEQEKIRFQAIDQDGQNLKGQLKNLALQKEETTQKQRQAEKDLKAEKNNILTLENEKVKIHNSVIELQAQISTLISRKKRLILDKEKLSNLLNENIANFKEAQAQCSQMLSQLNQLKEKKQKLTAEENEIKGKIETVKDLLSAQEKEFFELKASFEFLKDFRTKYKTFSRRENITVLFEKDPGNINKLVASLKDREFVKDQGGFKVKVEAKVIAFEEEQLLAKIADVEEKIKSFQLEIKNLEDKKESLSGQASSEDKRIEDQKEDFNRACQDKDSAQRELKRLKEEEQLVQEEASNTLSEIDDLQKKKEKESQGLEEKSNQLNKANSLFLSLQETIETCGENIKKIDIQAAQNKAQKESLFKERESVNSKVEFFKEEIGSIEKNIEQVKGEQSLNHSQAHSLKEKIEELNQKIEEENQKIKDSLAGKNKLEEKTVKLSREVYRQREKVESLKERHSQLKQSIYNQKLKVQSLEFEKEKVKDYLKQVYNLEIDLNCLEIASQPQQELLAKKEKLQKKINSLGEVNLVAIDEFQELKERKDFLEGQRTDLVTSKENLKKAINKINHTSRQIFLETFEKIEKEFKKNYKFLFNGGRAKLILIDPSDLLESGVEIEVQPPGKKLQNVSLLSGGEKALTAIALIFSIFTVKPSPLCVLDEIDAPLDEANVDRFNHMLKDFSQAAQFILITHNKKTMSNADVLYGVTMQQKGVSKLVSVKFAAEKAQS